ncbi:MAG: cytochrome b561 domain-containing protein [Pseudomonadota bacterium]
MLEWLLAPIDASRAHDVGWHLSWHARLMVLAWGVLAPLGVMAARFFKVLPWQKWPDELDSRVWWNAHRAAQYGSLVFMAAGLIVILSIPDEPVSVTASVQLHRWLGWVVLIFGAMQFLSGWMRGTKGGPTAPAADGSWHGDHYDMTRHRLIFEALHKKNGYVVIALSWAAVLTGLWQGNAPIWMWLLIIGWWCFYVAAFAILLQRVQVVPTYQAIWGPDPEHPGNQGPTNEGVSADPSQRGDLRL